MRRTRLRWGVAAFLIAVLSASIAACGGNNGTETSEAGAKVNPDLQGTLTIGAALPITGDSASIGSDQSRGAELAVERVNSEDGVLGKKLSVTVEDTQSDTVPAVQAARKLVSVDKVPVVVGEYLSARTIAIQKYLQRTGVVGINPGSSSPDIASNGSYEFSSIALDNIAGRYTANKLYDAGYRSIAYLGPNNPYGAEFARVIEGTFKDLGGDVTESILYTEGESSYRSELERMKDSNPELHVYATYVSDSITINKEAYELGIDPSDFFGIYLSIDIEDSPTQAIAGQQGFDLTYTGPEADQFTKAYEAKYGSSPKTPYSAYVYDAVLMAAAAINQANSADPDAVRKAMAEVGQDFPGATGSITLDSNGQRESQEYGLFTVSSDGKMEETGKIEGPQG